MLTAASTECRVCRCPATVTDGQSLTGWLAITGCACGRVFVWKPLWDLRLPFLPDGERNELADRIKAVGMHGTEPWLSTSDGRVSGPLVVSGMQPGLP